MGDVLWVHREQVGLFGVKYLRSWGWERDSEPGVGEGCDPTTADFLVPCSDATAGISWHRPTRFPGLAVIFF